ARSRRSTSTVENPRRAASRATPTPVEPPPMMRTSASSELIDVFCVAIETGRIEPAHAGRSTIRLARDLARMRMLLLLALCEVALVLGKLGVMLRLLLALRETAFVRGLGMLLARREIPLFGLALGMMLGRLLPGAKGALVPVLRLVPVRSGDAFWFLTLASHSGPPFQPASRQFRSCAGPPGARSTPRCRRCRAPTEDEFQSAPSASAERHSAQSKVRVTAFFQSAYSWSTVAFSMCGVHSLSLPQFSRRSSTCAQNPTARPAAYAAPSEVVSATVGRTTGTPRTSDWNCISVSLKTMPPSTLREVSATPESAFMASTISRVCHAVASSAARAMCPLLT